MKRFVILFIVLLGFSLGNSGTVSAGPVTYDFEDGTLQGWTPQPWFGGDLFVDVVGGNPGKFMVATDWSRRGGLFAKAPPPILGNLSTYSGIQWDAYIYNNSGSKINPDIWVKGSDGTLYRGGASPASVIASWHTRYLPFDDPSLWTLWPGTGTSSFTWVISHVESLFISMDTSGWARNNRESGIDNIVFIPANQPPVANTGTDQNIFLTLTALLDGSASSDPEGLPLSYLWAIDSAPAGSTATLSCTSCVNPNLTPDIAGTYVVSLVVNDGLLDSAAATVSITATQNLPPVAAATGSPLTGLLPLAVSFTAGASHDPEAGSLTYSWNFGDPSSPDNSSTLVNPIHTYDAVGTYNAVVTVADDFNQTDQAAVEIIVTAPNLPPSVSPTATPSSGMAPLNVQFTAGASDVNPADVLTYSWDFGDSGTSIVANPLHAYAVAGTYTSTVTVSDGVNPPVISSDLVISVNSPLSISVSESKVDYGKKGKVKGKISLKSDFTYPGMPNPSDVIKVVFDGITLLETSFSSFEVESEHPGQYEYESENVHAKIDFTKMTIKVSRHRMLLSELDASNGIDVVVYFGPHSATDHFVPKVKVKKHHDDEKEMSHKR